jgi:hypothetical protein
VWGPVTTPVGAGRIDSQKITGQGNITSADAGGRHRLRRRHARSDGYGDIALARATATSAGRRPQGQVRDQWCRPRTHEQVGHRILGRVPQKGASNFDYLGSGLVGAATDGGNPDLWLSATAPAPRTWARLP